MRKAEEARLKAMEEEARKRAEEQKRLQEENEARAREARELAEKQNAAELQAQAQRAAAPPPKPPPPPINYKLVGWLGPQQQRIAVFLNGKDIVLARKGEVLEGKFKLLSMAAESVEMGYVDPTYAEARKRLEMSP
jgi:DNA repair exonuclease SbcCD ATPase subunit